MADSGDKLTNKESAPRGAHAKTEVKAVVTGVKQQAEQTVREVRQSAESAMERRKDSAAAGLDAVADSFRVAGQEMNDRHVDLAARYSELAADQIDQIAGYLRGHQLRDLKRDAEDFARRHPAIFLGATALAGVLIGRFLRSSASHTPMQRFDADVNSDFSANTGRATVDRSVPSSPPPAVRTEYGQAGQVDPYGSSHRLHQSVQPARSEVTSGSLSASSDRSATTWPRGEGQESC